MLQKRQKKSKQSTNITEDDEIHEEVSVEKGKVLEKEREHLLDTKNETCQTHYYHFSIVITFI